MAAVARKVIIETKVIDKASKPTKDMGKAADHTADDFEELEKAALKVAKAAKKTAGGMKKADKETKKTGKSAKKTSGSMKLLASSFTNIYTAAAATAAIMAGGLFAAFGFIGKEAISVSADLEKFETRLGILLGSAEKGKKTLDELFEISQRTPFQVGKIIEAEAVMEQFGLNAPKWRDGVMDLAGAMGMDLVEAATPVGTAVAGGAGAADILKTKGVKAMVEVQAGMNATKKSTDEWRKALHNTLTTHKKFAGGTAKLATTYSGLMSTLKDQFAGFARQVGKARLFEAAKLVLTHILKVLGENKKATKTWAEVVGEGLTEALLLAVSAFGPMMAAIGYVIKRFNVGRSNLLKWRVIIDGIVIAFARTLELVAEIAARMPGAAGTEAEGVREWAAAKKRAAAASMKASTAEHARIVKQNSAIDASVAKWAKVSANVGEIRRQLAEMPDDIAGGVGAGPAGLMRGKGLEEETKGGKGGAGQDPAAQLAAHRLKQEEAAAKLRQKYVDKYTKLIKKSGQAVDGLVRKQEGQNKQSDKYTQRLSKLRQQLARMGKEADELGIAVGGPKMNAMFAKTKEQIKEMESLRVQALAAEKIAIQQAAAAAKAASSEKAAGVVEGVAGAVGSGGMSALGAAGPWGAATAGIISLGQGGGEAREAEVEKIASERAAKRQEEKGREREAQLAAGASEQQLAAMGLSEADIEKAGEVTKKDIAAAEQLAPETKDFVKDQIMGIVEGITMAAIGIIEALPDIIVDLIPMLITEFIPELIVAVFKMIPKLMKAIFYDLPIAIWKGVKKWWAGVRDWFNNLFSFGSKQTGGFVHETGRYLLHQGERVVPPPGAATGTAEKGLRAFAGGGHTINVNAAVVDQDTIPALGRLINQELGEFGRMAFPVFNS